jgi:hypothetical protein
MIEDDPGQMTSSTTTTSTRRGFLRLLTAGAAGLALAPLLPRTARVARAAAPAGLGDIVAGRVRDIDRGRLGTTLWLELANGPFPYKGARFKDATTAVFVPRHFRVPKDRQIDTVLHFHGHDNTVAKAFDRYELREQVYDSRQNCILVLPQGPVNAKDSSGGKLDQPGGLLRFLTELRKTIQTRPVAKALGKAALPGGARIGTLCVSAHSGGYRVTARCLEAGGYPISEVYLFDALYGDEVAYAEWLAATKDSRDWRTSRKLVNFYCTKRPTHHSKVLMSELAKRGVSYLHEEKEGELTRQQLIKGRAIFIRTPLNHRSVVFRHNTLRDCLYASRLDRYEGTDWFERKKQPRRIDQRKPR